MLLRSKVPILILLLSLASVQLGISSSAFADTGARNTPLVKAIRGCSESVVNLRGRKTIQANEPGSNGTVKQVNGMGTGVVIDSRGYILTNFHVVEGVKNIQVTTSDGTKTTARLIAHDLATDLAILKVNLPKPLKVIKIGSSSDLMLAETVAAVGNAYGYEHTVTVGIISQLGRTVQVNDQQTYRNLIQTDAPINPGNSGGPLLNLNGEMIGINVAVRIGAQGIAFAIPINDALKTAAQLMKQVVGNDIYHGLKVKTKIVDDRPQLVVESVLDDSPAQKAGIEAGDQLTKIGDTNIQCELDFQCSLVDAKIEQDLNVQLLDGEQHQRDVTLHLAKKTLTSNAVAWKSLGVKLAPVAASEMRNRHPNYTRGLRIVEVRDGSPADSEGIIEGDILVAMHGWKTETIANLVYILQQPDVKQSKDFMFYILRDKEPFWGQMRIASRPR